MTYNVLFIHHVSCLAGAERYLLSLIQSLDKRYRVFFICQEPGPLTEELAKRGVVIECLRLKAWRQFKNIIDNLKTVLRVIKFCQQHDIHLICSNNYRVSSYAVLAAKWLRIPSITIIQDFVPYNKLAKFNTFMSDALIAVSNAVSVGFKDRFQKPLTIIYNGMKVPALDKSQFHDDVLRRVYPELQHKRIVGMVAHLIPLKQHDMFLRLAKVICEVNKDVMFVIVGDSPNEKQLSLQDLKNLAERLGVKQRVIFTGNHPDAMSLIKSFDVLVHPSKREAFGRVIMEAMSLAVPVVATACGGPEEIIKDGESGYLVPIDDEAELLKKVNMLLADQALAHRIGEEGRKRIEMFFNEEQTLFKANGFFHDILTK